LRNQCSFETTSIYPSSCAGYKGLFQQVAREVHTKYPEMKIIGEVDPPPPTNALIAQYVFLLSGQFLDAV
jgi:hypothetical protein